MSERPYISHHNIILNLAIHVLESELIMNFIETPFLFDYEKNHSQKYVLHRRI